jgi:hypothetical protein
LQDDIAHHFNINLSFRVDIAATPTINTCIVSYLLSAVAR